MKTNLFNGMRQLSLEEIKMIGKALLAFIAATGGIVLLGLFLNPFIGWLFDAYDFICIALEILAIVFLILCITVCFTKRSNKYFFSAIFLGVTAGCIINGVLYCEYSRPFYLGNTSYSSFAKKYGKCTLLGECDYYDGRNEEAYWSVRTPWGGKMTINRKAMYSDNYYTMGAIFPAEDRITGEKRLLIFNIDDKEDYGYQGFHFELLNTQGDYLCIIPEDKKNWKPYVLGATSFEQFTYIIDYLTEQLGVHIDNSEIERIHEYYDHTIL